MRSLIKPAEALAYFLISYISSESSALKLDQHSVWRADSADNKTSSYYWTNVWREAETKNVIVSPYGDGCEFVEQETGFITQ